MHTSVYTPKWIVDYLNTVVCKMKCNRSALIRDILSGTVKLPPPQSKADMTKTVFNISLPTMSMLQQLEREYQQSRWRILEMFIDKASADCKDTGSCPYAEDRPKPRKQAPEQKQKPEQATELSSDIRGIVREALVSAIKDIVRQELQTILGKDILGFSGCPRK